MKKNKDNVKEEIKKENVKSIDKKEKSKTKSTKKKSKFAMLLSDFFCFYKKNLRKKHVIVYIIMLVLFGTITASLISNIDVSTVMQENMDNTEYAKTWSYAVEMLKNETMLLLITVVAGMVPFVYIPIITMACVPYTYAQEIYNVFIATIGSKSMLFLLISSVFQLIGMSLAVVIGIHYCKNATKKYIYSQKNSYGFKDFKIQFYEMIKKNKKAEELRNKKKEELEKNQKLNVKIDYKNIIIGTIIAIVILSLSLLISLI